MTEEELNLDNRVKTLESLMCDFIVSLTESELTDRLPLEEANILVKTLEEQVKKNKES